MPFTRETFGPMAGVSTGRLGPGQNTSRGTPRLFSYATPDNSAAVIAANYFDELIDAVQPLRSTLGIGDIIFASCEQGLAADQLRNRLEDDTVTPVIFRVTNVTPTEITVVVGDTL